MEIDSKETLIGYSRNIKPGDYFSEFNEQNIKRENAYVLSQFRIESNTYICLINLKTGNRFSEPLRINRVKEGGIIQDKDFKYLSCNLYLYKYQPEFIVE